MDSLNRLFTEKAVALRADAMRDLDAFLILYNDCLYVDSRVEHDANSDRPFERFATLDLQRYTVYKTLAHYIVYMSLKHDCSYEKIDDLCEKLREQVADTASSATDIKQFFNCDVSTLMRLASNEYVAQLHSIVQRVKNERYQATWPEKMLILVCGPASPRYGHPAMQYFARLANKPLEQLSSHCASPSHCVMGNCGEARDEITYVPQDATQYRERRLFYVENAHDLDEAVRIGLSLYVEETVFSRFVSMKTDILAPMVQATLKKQCQK